MPVAAPPRATPAHAPAPPAAARAPFPGDPVTVAYARYRTRAELAAHLSALGRFGAGRLAAVVGLRPGAEPPPAPDARLVLTADRPVPRPDLLPAPFEADPFRAVAGTAAGLAPGDALLVLVPADWAGPSPEYLVEQGRRWRAAPDAAEDGEFYPIDESRPGRG